MFVIKHRNKFFILSALLVAFSLFSVGFWGLNLGIEFTGGSIVEVSYSDGRPDIPAIQAHIEEVLEGDVRVQPSGENSVIVRAQELAAEDRAAFLNALRFEGEHTIEEERYSVVGPSIGTELTRKAFVAIALVALGIIAFIAFAFRKAGEDAEEASGARVSAWFYGGIAVVALLHDIIIPTGIFAFLGSRFIDAQIDVLFVTALLAILGYSVNDTIVVFDRVRENLRRVREEHVKKQFGEIVGTSIRETAGRSINTSLTTLLVLVPLYVLGGAATQNFALVLIIGVLAGTYSSLFLAAPLLAVIASRKR